MRAGPRRPQTGAALAWSRVMSVARLRAAGAAGRPATKAADSGAGHRDGGKPR